MKNPKIDVNQKNYRKNDKNAQIKTNKIENKDNKTIPNITQQKRPLTSSGNSNIKRSIKTNTNTQNKNNNSNNSDLKKNYKIEKNPQTKIDTKTVEKKLNNNKNNDITNPKESNSFPKNNPSSEINNNNILLTPIPTKIELNEKIIK